MPHTHSLDMNSLLRSPLSVCLVLICLVFGTPLSATGWHTSGVQIDNPSGAPFIITGLNWYGFETTSYVAHGMYTKDYTFILNEVKQYGFYTIRLPISNQMWENNPITCTNYTSVFSHCSGHHTRDIMTITINTAVNISMHVILD